MGFNNSSIPWRSFEALLSGKTPPSTPSVLQTGRPLGADGSDSPAWTRKRRPFEPSAQVEQPTSLRQELRPYVELHCHSYFSFLDGASPPEELVETAHALGYQALALTDHSGMYGAVRFAEAAQTLAIPTIFGAEISVGDTDARTGSPDPDGNHLVVLARSPEGYRRLSSILADAHMSNREKGRTVLSLNQLAYAADAQHFAILTGCRKGFVSKALATGGTAHARTQCEQLTDMFGKEHVFIELWDHRNPEDRLRNIELQHIASDLGLSPVVTNNVHYATTKRKRLASIVAAIRAKKSLDEIDGWLPSIAQSYLQQIDVIYDKFAHIRDAIQNSVELGMSCAFNLSLIAPNLPDCRVPDGHTEISWLRELVARGAKQRYGPRTHEAAASAYQQIDHELALIERLGFPGYFLIVHDIVQFCYRNNIFCQGRGSAANSAVCYALGITNADSVALGLLFERFLSPERDGPPDIDIDIESGRREEVIQYVYQRYGRDRAALVCNVITYQSRSAVHDVARAFGYERDLQDTWSRQIDRWSRLGTHHTDVIPTEVLEHAAALQTFPRHLGIHPGGMVLCDRPVAQVCPTEWARMKDRSVLQWDKDDCAQAGLVKFDLLGLGMLSMLHEASDLIVAHFDKSFDMARIPQEDAVYDMLCQGDSLGVFQVESRAQIATLPRLAPRTFYDLVVEVALIRPGPIQGGSVHPYIRRRNGIEPVTYLHPLLEPSLKKTLGIPLFQEQLMQIAIDVAGFTPSDADKLRVAMSSKRSKERMKQLRQKLYDGMRERGVPHDIANVLYDKLAAFANFGFPESHAVSFAYLVYASAWIKRFYPQCFLAALLNAQPMGFWSPRSLVADAERHGVVVRGPDINLSKANATIEPDGSVRIGLSDLNGIGQELAQQIATRQPYDDMEMLMRANMLSLRQLETLASSGACASLGISRRSALWSAGAVAQLKDGQLAGILTGLNGPQLPEMSPFEETLSDLFEFGVTPGRSLLQFLRNDLQRIGVTRASDLLNTPNGTKVKVGGIVTHRQRPATAQGITFVNIEDETGMTNIVCSRGFWKRFRKVITSEPTVIVRGKLERQGRVINVVAEHVQPLPVKSEKMSRIRSRDFR